MTRTLRIFALLVSALILVGCVGMRPVYHSVSIVNKSSVPIYDVELLYDGLLVNRFIGLTPPDRVRGSTAEEIIPKTITVNWKSEGGARLSEVIPVQLKGIVDDRQLGAFEVIFTEAGLELRQGKRTNFPEREYLRIFP